jgi:hypothetical protein
VILLFEELFENSSPSQLKDHFQMFMDYVREQNGLYPPSIDIKQIANIELYTARMCKFLMKKINHNRDSEFKSKVQEVLASLLPLGHPSGVNLPGRISDSKVTI